MGNSDVEALKRRFARRLDQAMAARGYPALRNDRCTALGAALHLTPSAANLLIGGFALPEPAALVALCREFGQQPGFFLDESDEPLPNGVVAVRPFNTGEVLALRLPSEDLEPGDANKGLVYYEAHEPLGFGIRRGDYVIAFDFSVLATPKPGKLYLFRGQSGMEVRLCTETEVGRAVFRAEDPASVPSIVSSGMQRATRSFSEVVATITPVGRLQNQLPSQK